MRRCFGRAWREIRPTDRKACSVRPLVRGAGFISVIANNHLAIRVPAWTDAGFRVEGDILLIWPQSTRPSVMSAKRFRQESAGRFKLIPHFNLSLMWEECLDLERCDWQLFRDAVNDGLTMARTRRRISNVIVD